ncbi:MAG: PDZ domain-containing protein [Hyphomicrobiaceae bacterium]
MTTPRSKLGRAFSARRLILLATAGNLAIAALLVGPANAAEGAASSRGWIGVQIQPVTSAIAESLGIKESKGALVAEPRADSPAAKAGIQPRDVITAVNGNSVNNPRDLATQIGGLAPGAAVNVTIWREGAEKSIALTLGEMPKERAAAMPQPAPTGTDVPKLGLMLAAAEHVAGGGSEGVVVVDIDPRGLAFEQGFKAGDIILDVGGKKVVSPVDVRNAIRDAQMNGKRAVLMRLKSDEVTRFVAIPIARV